MKIAKYKILAVDDVKINLDLLKELLKCENTYEVATETDGNLALNKALKPSSFDLILLDLSFPNDPQFGYKFARTLREHEIFTPIIDLLRNS